MGRTMTIAEAKARPLEELLREIAETQEPLQIETSDGQVVEIKPVLRLKPLESLPGSVPDGWKDAIYEPRR